MRRRPTKPCAKCHHGKSHHRRHECRVTWQATGATFMGNRFVTKWCQCEGYVETLNPDPIVDALMAPARRGEVSCPTCLLIHPEGTCDR